ncbi:hypothetical protein ACLB2K_045696 [Fragaria x ananassa]
MRLPLISHLSIFSPNPSHHGSGIQSWRSTPIPGRSSSIPGRLSPISRHSSPISSRFSSASVHTVALGGSFLAIRSVEGGFLATKIEECCKIEAFWSPYLLKATTKDLCSTKGGTGRAFAGLDLMMTHQDQEPWLQFYVSLVDKKASKEQLQEKPMAVLEEMQRGFDPMIKKKEARILKPTEEDEESPSANMT